MLPLQFVLFAYLFFAQGLCHTLPQPKARTARDTSNIPTHLFKPVGEKSNNEKISNRSFLNGNGTTLVDPEDDGVEFLERGSAEVEEVTSSYEDEDVRSNRFRPPPRPYFPQNSQGNIGPIRRPPQYGNGFPTDYSEDPRGQFRGGSSLNNRPFINSPNFPNRFAEPQYGSQDTPSWVSRSIPVPLGNSMIPLFSGGPSSSLGQSGPNGRNGPITSGGSSNNFYRTESYSYTSDGRGPPQVERNVYDSRDGLGASFRNF
ncbi:uncharacterized protein LOC108139078 [Drosophila elegans]|uniref:uncharacterized protein LOC108139078 n=1 Tax=Drosophila elegans TaxID=30023 RepID=UPI0007E605CB|nr:uncharacterized protein LOC108139078 [Drosophila elegans]